MGRCKNARLIPVSLQQPVFSTFINLVSNNFYTGKISATDLIANLKIA